MPSAAPPTANGTRGARTAGTATANVPSDTRSGTVDLAVPKLREGSYFPGWLLTPRKRSEQALVAAIADMYLAGVSTRRVDKLVRTLGIEGISKSEVSRLVRSIFAQPEAERHDCTIWSPRFTQFAHLSWRRHAIHSE
jgi:putative transposase